MQIFTKIDNLDLKYFDQAETYNDIQKASQESSRRSFSILKTLIDIVRNLASVLGAVIILLRVSVFCTILCFLSIIPFFLINNKILNKWFEVFNRRFEQLRYVNYLKSICTRYENIKELKIFNTFSFLQNKMLDVYNKNINEDKVIRKSFLKQNLLINLLDEAVMYFIKGIIVYISILQKLSIGAVVIYLQSVDLTKMSLSNMMSLISQTYEDSLYMSSIFNLLDIQIEENNKMEFNYEFKTIKFVDVSFKYPGSKKYVIKNFNYIFEANKTYGIVGLNGSGKTTLVKLILNLYEVSSGKIYIDDIDINEISKKSMYKFVSAIFQDFIKYPISVRENISLGNEKLNDSVIEEAVKFTNAKKFIENLPQAYETKLNKQWSGGTDISIGQWQKIAIARAAIKKSVVLILDEPTASIDAVAEYEMFNNFKYLRKDKLCVLVTHRLSSIKAVDKILVLDNGTLVESGSHEKLMDYNGLYRELFNMQAEAYEDKIETYI